MPKQLSGAAKKRKRKLDNEIRESQRGDLDKYFPATTTSSVDVNNNNQSPISNPRQDDQNNADGDIELNEQSLDNNSK